MPSRAERAWAPPRPRAGRPRRRTAAAGSTARAPPARERRSHARSRPAARGWARERTGSVVTRQSGFASSNWITISCPRADPDMRPASRATRFRLTSVATGAEARSSSASRSAAASSSSAKAPAWSAWTGRSSGTATIASSRASNPSTVARPCSPTLVVAGSDPIERSKAVRRIPALARSSGSRSRIVRLWTLELRSSASRLWTAASASLTAPHAEGARALVRLVTPEGGPAATESGLSPLLSDDIGALELLYGPAGARSFAPHRTNAPPPRRHVSMESQFPELTPPLML